MKITVVGSGSFGTALAIMLAKKNEYKVSLTGRNKEELANIEKNRENTRYLPGVIVPENLKINANQGFAISEADVLLFSVPSQAFGKVLSDFKDRISSDALIVNVAKGIEQGTLRTLSEVAEDVIPGCRYVALSGPSHAEEVGRMLPTTVVSAAKNEEDAKKAQKVFMTERFRVYTNHDLKGVELGGSLKNIMALAAGISDGLSFGDNAKAALITRGMTEMTRLGVALGAKKETFAGLSGMGDLVVTCTSRHSRNRNCGFLIGQGLSKEKAIAEVGMVVEGIYTCESAYMLSKKYSVEMPITSSLKDCLDGKLSASEAIKNLMNRPPKPEN